MPDYTEYIEAHIERNRKETAELAKLRTEAIAEAKEIATFLAERYRADRVLLYGSYADGTHHDGSDVDIAVEGLGSGFWQAWQEVEEMTKFDIDLRPFEDFPESSKKLILSNCITLYEKGTDPDVDR